MESDYLSIKQVDGHITQYKFLKISRFAVDEFADSLLKQNLNTITCILVDTRIGIQPIRYTMAKLRETFQDGALMADVDIKIYVAIVLDDSTFSTISMNFINSLNLKNIHFRFFGKTDYEVALMWLNSFESPHS